MSEQKKTKYHKLIYNIYFYFAITVVIFALFSGIIFIRLYHTSTMESYNTLLSAQAETISQQLSQYIITEDYDNYPLFLEMLQSSNNMDFWISSNKKAENPMDERMENVNYQEEELDDLQAEVLKRAFGGETYSCSGFNKIYEMMTINIGCPIYNEKDEVVGALVLIAPIERQYKSIEDGLILLLISMIGAMIISSVLAAIFARQISNPITQISKATLRLAEGEFVDRVPVRGKDEITQLASCVEVLSSRLQENEIQRKNLDKMRMDFFANVSHELRTPITVIRGYTESLVDGVVIEREKLNQYYNRILAECKGMERLISDLLLLAKMENPDFVIERNPVDIYQVLDDTVRGAKIICNDKKITIEMKQNGQYLFTMGDYDRLKQMFMVILDNAIKFSKCDSKIYIKIECEDKIIISIRDCGIGMDSHQLKYIFTKFYTSKLNNNKDGTGLGLAIAKGIADKHNAVIRVESELGEGTVFIFELELLLIDSNEIEKLFN